ncbi:hypothetical protein GS943_18910 [Rhodococcus hoagii]|nr:hypothetical protein [Prescottella equi]
MKILHRLDPLTGIPVRSNFVDTVTMSPSFGVVLLTVRVNLLFPVLPTSPNPTRAPAEPSQRHHEPGGDCGASRLPPSSELFCQT